MTSFKLIVLISYNRDNIASDQSWGVVNSKLLGVHVLQVMRTLVTSPRKIWDIKLF